MFTAASTRPMPPMPRFPTRRYFPATISSSCLVVMSSSSREVHRQGEQYGEEERAHDRQHDEDADAHLAVIVGRLLVWGRRAVASDKLGLLALDQQGIDGRPWWLRRDRGARFARKRRRCVLAGAVRPRRRRDRAGVDTTPHEPRRDG